MKNITNTNPREFVIAGLIGIGASLLVMMAMLVVISTLVYRGTIEENMHHYMCALILTASSFVGSMISARVMGAHKIVVSFICGALYWIVLVVINILLFEGRFDKILPTSLLIMGSCLGAGLVCLRTNNRKQYSQKRTKSKRLYKMHK